MKDDNDDNDDDDLARSLPVPSGMTATFAWWTSGILSEQNTFEKFEKSHEKTQWNKQMHHLDMQIM